MLTMNSHGVEISIVECVEEIVCDPNSLALRVPLYRGSSPKSNPALLILCITQVMTHSESQCEIHQLTPTSQLRNLRKPMKTDKTNHVS